MISLFIRSSYFLKFFQWRVLFAMGVLAGLLTACGQGSTSVVETETTMRLSLTRTTADSSSGISAKAAGDNLVDLSGTWSNWLGQETGITYDAAENALVIPGDGSDIVLGVQRFDVPLTGGVSYSLSVQASDDQAAALLFLFDTSGMIVPVPGSTGLAVANPSTPIEFIAPESIAGFYLQVQNRYQADGVAQLSAQLIEGGGTSTGASLIDLSEPWTDWVGNATGVAAAEGGLNIPAPDAGQNIALGVKWFDTPLSGGTDYALSLGGLSDQGTAVLLFLFDTNGQIVPFAENGQSLSWIAATSGAPAQFTAPTGIVGFAVQVQGPYQDRTGAFISPSLTVIEAQGIPTISQTGRVQQVSYYCDNGDYWYVTGPGVHIDGSVGIASVLNRRIYTPGDGVNYSGDEALTIEPYGYSFERLMFDSELNVIGYNGCTTLADREQSSGQPAQMGTLLSCTRSISGGRITPSTSTYQQFAMVRSINGVLTYEVSAADSGQVSSRELVEIVGTVPQPRATFSEGENGLTTWSFATGGFNPATNEVVFGSSVSIVFDRRTGSVSSYRFSDGPALTGLATLTTINCVSAQ